MKKTKHTIKNAHDAWWFLRDHPKFRIMERDEVSPKKAAKLKKEGYLITRDEDGTCYRMWRHIHRAALSSNLDIYFTKTNKPGGHGRVDDDDSKNKYVECWLEFGPEEYMPVPWDKRTRLTHTHDWRLDTGGSTFDDALVNLAKLVKKHYGDYEPHKRKDECGKPVCADCTSGRRMMKNMGLVSKAPK